MTARLGWENVRSLIEEQTGPVLAAEPATEGLNSEIAVTVRTSAGATFVKGLRSDHRRVWTQQREAEINPYVLQVSPRLRWHVETDGWNLLGFEHIQGRRVDYSPGSPDLPKVVHVMRQLDGIPCPALPIKQAEQRWSSYTDTPELFAGEHLLHTEWSPGNVVVNDAAQLVDWAWPTRGAGWIDPASWVVWLVASGHSPESAEDWATQVPAWRTTPSGHDGFVEYYRGYAWLKMPLDDGLRLLNTLLGTTFRDRVTIRWQPGSWPTHVPLVYGESDSIDVAEAVQLHFPMHRSRNSPPC